MSWACADPSLVVVTFAVLSYVEHSVADVVAVMWTLKLPPAARSVGPQPRTWAGLVPVIAHRPALDCVSIDQVTPAPEPAGKLSVTVTPLAVPVPLFVTLIVKPILSPALTSAESAFFA